jgi:hypothetical protein
MRAGANTAALAIAFALAMAPSAGRAQPSTGGESLPSSPSGQNRMERGTSGLSVTASGCPELKMDRIEDQLRLELATLVPTVAHMPPLEVDFHCDGLSVRVTLSDSVTAKWVARDVVLSPTARVEQERTLALAASELFLASWAELLLDKPEGQPSRRPDPVVFAAESAVRRAVPALANMRLIELDVLVQGRERHLSTPVPTLGAALRVGQTRTAGWQLFATGGWEGGVAQRSSGRVQVDAGEAGLGLRWGWHLGGLRLDAAGTVSAMYVSLQGVPSSGAFFGATHGGFTADIAADIEASVSLNMLRLGAALAGGYIAPGPVGIVDQATAVRLDGPWVGATLLCGFAL